MGTTHDVIILSAIIAEIYCCLCRDGMEKRIKKLSTYNPGKNMTKTERNLTRAENFDICFFLTFNPFLSKNSFLEGRLSVGLCAHPNGNSRLSILLLHRQRIYFYDDCTSNYGVFFCTLMSSLHMSLKSCFHGNSSIYNLWKSMVFFTKSKCQEKPSTVK